MGKTEEERKLRELMREKLSTTSIPDLMFEDIEGHQIKFSELYDYHRFLGSGAFGFVVAALDKKTGQSLALKVRAPSFLHSSDNRQKLPFACQGFEEGGRYFEKHSAPSKHYRISLRKKLFLLNFFRSGSFPIILSSPLKMSGAAPYSILSGNGS